MRTITCPFCNRRHIHDHPFNNIFCPCGSKYYGVGNIWLNRRTGEYRKGEERDE